MYSAEQPVHIKGGAMKNNFKDVYTIVEKENDKNIWIRIGTAFVNKDDSLTISLNALPTNGKLHVREQFNDKNPKKE